MSAWVFGVVTLWLLGLCGVLVVFAARARSTVVRALALDTLALMMVAELAVIGIHRREPGFLDVALVLAMLGFVQTVATGRLVERREDLR